MRFLIIFLLLFSYVWAYEWIPVYNGAHQIYDVLNVSEEGIDTIIGCENGLLILNGEEVTQLETSLPVWKVLPFDEENFIFIQGNGSYSDGVYLLNKSTYDITVLEWIIYPRFLVYDETNEIFFLGTVNGLHKSNGGDIWVEDLHFQGMHCWDMAMYNDHFVVSTTGGDSNISYSNNNGEDWFDASSNLPLTDLEFNSEGILYGIFPNLSNSSGLWKSTDFGENWQVQIYMDNCTKVGVAAFDHIFLGSDDGMYRVDGDYAYPVHYGLANTNINDFIYDPDVLAPNIIALTDSGIYMLLNFMNFRNLLVPQQYSTIQEAVIAACTGETILLADGTYMGEGNRNITWDGNLKHILIKSVNGYENCIIDCEDENRAFSFINSNQTQSDEIRGITIKNGYAEWDAGGAIAIENCSLTIKNNMIINNFATSGGGIYCYQSDSNIASNIISSNEAMYGGMPGTCAGGGISVAGGSPSIRHNEISNNSAAASDMESTAVGAGIAISNSNAELVNNLIIGNEFDLELSSMNLGSAIYAKNMNDEIATIFNNTILDSSDAVYEAVYLQRGVQFKNNICHGELRVEDPVYAVEVSYNNSYGSEINYSGDLPGLGDSSWGTNWNGTACDEYFNISEDPSFAGNLEFSYYLSQLEAGQSMQSACVDAGAGEPEDYGLDGYTTRTDSISDEAFIDMGFHKSDGITLVGTENFEVPGHNFIQLSNYPNPFNPSTIIFFSLTTECTENTEVEIYNVKGQKVKSIVCHSELACPERSRREGRSTIERSVTWNGTDNQQNAVSSGVYLYRIKADDFVSRIQKMTLLK